MERRRGSQPENLLTHPGMLLNYATAALVLYMLATGQFDQDRRVEPTPTSTPTVLVDTKPAQQPVSSATPTPSVAVARG